MKLFEKADVEGWKALVPGLNFVEWAKLIGRKPTYALWLLFPVVNIFIWCGMAVDLVRAFGRFSFLSSALAVIYTPLEFFLTGKSPDSKYEPNVVGREKAYQEQVKEALAKKDKFALNKLENSVFHKGGLREWVEAIFFAVFAAAFIRMFIFEMYVIPTSSMEGSLLVGDYLAVGKFNFGLRTPMTVVQIPLLHNQIPVVGSESYINPPSLPYFRLPAMEKLERNSPFVFNWPIGDSIIMTPERSWNINQLREQRIPYRESDLIVRPIDKKDHYIKRCVAIAGDKLEIRDRQIYINDQPAQNPSNMQFAYRVTGNYNPSKLEEWGVHLNDFGDSNMKQGVFPLNAQQVEKIKSMGGGVNVELLPNTLVSPSVFPHDTVHFKWSVDNFGPLVIPAKDATIQLSNDNIKLYERIIAVYENNKLETKGGKIFINGSETTSYTFKQNYYWAMGDNRHNSEDSRYWGFVPEDHIVGKPLFIWMSTGNNGIRWNRIFTTANKM
ncbi:MAG: signal peptidase I [Saprospiraceae bacterium]|nr:signal peptidase I [Saprospiraceae bacterium]